jgi:membrane fusion protein, copper/silver efflux system
MDGTGTRNLYKSLLSYKLHWPVLIVVAFVAGYYLSGHRQSDVQTASPAPPASADKGVSSGEHAKKPAPAAWWTCSMHPQIRLPNPGKCPICSMDLIPLETGHDHAAETGALQLTMSQTAKTLAEVQTTPVKRERATVQVRMVGMVAEDERKIATLTSRVEGRLDRVYVNFTGERVSKGDPMVTIWSPTLIKSQVELFEALRGPLVDEGVIKGAEEKLVQYGLTPDQVQEIKDKKKPILYVTLRAPISGIVTQRMAFLGQFVKEGSDMFIINDLSHVWVKMDAYETDLPWIRYGQDVTFSTPAVPGRDFKGKVLFIDPVLDGKTRSIKIRAEAENPEFTLKPGMFVSAQLEAEVDSKGRLIKSEWVGKYVCPTHPTDDPSPTPGLCPISNMPLRPAASYGYADDANPEFPLVIPSTAPLITGKRAIVYVDVPDRDRPTYQLREVVLGPRAGDQYVVYSGLKEGERVVTRGNFKIDSAMQILARPSMMAPPEESKKPEPVAARAEEEAIEKIKAPQEFLNELTPVVEAYLKLKDALVEERQQEAAQWAGNLGVLVKQVNGYLLDAKGKETWKDLSGSMLNALKTIEQQQDVAAMRKAFDPLSESFAKAILSFRHVLDHPLFLYHCPMAFDSRGAYWIEPHKDATNPYFGRKPLQGQDMLKCGVLTETIPSETGASEGKKRGNTSSFGPQPSPEPSTGEHTHSMDAGVSMPPEKSMDAPSDQTGTGPQPARSGGRK